MKKVKWKSPKLSENPISAVCVAKRVTTHICRCAETARGVRLVTVRSRTINLMHLGATTMFWKQDASNSLLVDLMGLLGVNRQNTNSPCGANDRVIWLISYDVRIRLPNNQLYLWAEYNSINITAVIHWYMSIWSITHVLHCIHNFIIRGPFIAYIDHVLLQI